MNWLCLVFSFCVFTAQAQMSAKAEYDYYTQVVDLFNKKKFEESLALLEQNRNYADKSAKWHYFYGINKLRLGDYDSAIQSLNAYIERNSVARSSRASYYLGVAYFHKQEYENAVNSLQLSLDLSLDPKMDSATEAFLEKTIKYYDYYENHHKTSLLMMLGYGFKSNALDVSQDLSEDNLTGHSLNYGLAIGYRAIDKLDFVFEPTINFIDKYSLDHKFSESGVIQSSDTMQLLLSLPVIYKNKSENILYNISLNSYASYLPITSSTRELYLTSHFINGKVGYDITSQYMLETNLVFASDETKVFSNTDADATGYRYGFNLLLARYFDRSKLRVFNMGLGFTQKTAKGNDVFYENSSLSSAYTVPYGQELQLSVAGAIDYIVYPKKTTRRSDLKSAVNFSATQLFTNSNLSYGLGCVVNNSNEELYKYNDIQASVVYLYKFGF